MRLHLQVQTCTLYSHLCVFKYTCNRIKDFSVFVHLAGAMDVALGSAATGAFTNSDWLWERLHKVMSGVTQM